jgi:putative redox protein
MAVEITVTYKGGLRCEAVHGPSGTRLVSDAPVDNQGRGESFSPTDLVATALGTCMLTIMGIVAARHGIALEGATARVEKHMVADPARRVGRLPVVIRVPGRLDDKQKKLLMAAAEGCPVHRTLGERVEMPIVWEWAQ